MSQMRIVEWLDDVQSVRLVVGKNTVTVRYDIVDQMVVIRQVSGDNLTSRLLRDLNIGSLRQELFLELQRNPSRLAAAFKDHVLRDVSDFKLTTPGGWNYVAQQRAPMIASKLQPPGRGRGKQRDEFYRDIALMYLDAVEQHGQRVIAEMTEELQKSTPKLSRNTVSTWVRRAREEGWLTRSTQGKAGAQPGPRLVDWLADRETQR